MSREYTWVQNEAGLNATPITWTVKVRVMGDTGVAVAESFRDARGVEWSEVSHYSTTGTLMPCEIFDKGNWECWLRSPEGGRLVEFKMSSGKLVWSYWGDRREMSTRYRVLGF